MLAKEALLLREEDKMQLRTVDALILTTDCFVYKDKQKTDCLWLQERG